MYYSNIMWFFARKVPYLEIIKCYNKIKNEVRIMLPQDPVMLLSYINTQLRDNYGSLDALADELDISEDEKNAILNKLSAIGYVYNSESNQFK